MVRILHSRVAANAFALGMLGADYGITLPQRIVFEVSAVKSGDSWNAVVTSMTGEYSRQARVLPHQADIAPLALAATVNAGNFQAIRDALEQLGDPGGAHNHYCLAAVEAHEDAHANRCRLALEDLEDQIVGPVQALSVPIRNGGADRTEAQALTAMQALPAYAAAVGANAGWIAALRAADDIDPPCLVWLNRLLHLVAQDHAAHGPCETAERRVVRPMIERIDAMAVANRWIAGPAQIVVPNRALDVAGARAAVTPVTPPPRAGPPAPVRVPDEALGVDAAKEQIRQAAEVPPPRRADPTELPDGALGVAGAMTRLKAAAEQEKPKREVRLPPRGNLPVWPPPPK